MSRETLTSPAQSSRNRLQRGEHGQDSSYFLGWVEYERNPYHPLANLRGIIQMGLAENQLSFDLLESWLAANPGAASFQRKDGVSLFRELALFQDYHGLPAFKKAMARFMGELRGGRVQFDADKLVLTAGSTSANEILMFCLAQPGDAFLLPTPYYPGFDRDLKWRTGVEIVPIHCTSSNGFRITKPALERAYRLAGKRGAKVKGVLITNPSNPLGTTMTREELRLLLDFVVSKGAHLVSDEIYSGTVFGSEPNGFVSVMEAVQDVLQTDPASTVASRVHVVYSMSKDLGLPGFRVGAIYSNDTAVVETATKMSSFSLISSQTQFLLSQMLADEEFTRGYTAENHRRLKRRRDALVLGLEEVGIPCLQGNAGLFCWADMRGLLAGGRGGFEAEMELWKEILYKVGINISPGSSCHCSEPGWFRICFANMEEETLTIAMQRIRAFIHARRGKHQLQAVCNKSSLTEQMMLQLTVSQM